MQTLIICLLLLYNAWLVTYIIFGRRRTKDNPTKERLPFNPPKTDSEIVGKSLFKMTVKEPQVAIREPQATTSTEGEDINDIDATFANEIEEKPSARLSGDELDNAFKDIRMSDVPQEYDEDEQERMFVGQYATGASFEEIGGALKIAGNPSATVQERNKAGQIFSDMEGNALFNLIIEKNPNKAKRIMGLMDEISKKFISGEGKAKEVSVQPLNKTEVRVPDDISGFDIRDFV